MFLKHEYFTIDTEGRRVFDENDKELRLTGNAYRVLLFLCQKKNATITEIGTHLDFAKDYNEDHIRQYRYKINTIIGYDVMDYKNGIYSIIGEIKERNTDLLHDSNITSEAYNNMAKTNALKLNIYPALIASLLLLLSFINWPVYAYYTLMKIVVTCVAIYYAYYLYKVTKRQNFWFWAFVIIAIIFNPVFPIYLYNKSIWMVIDLITIFILISFIYEFKNKKITNKIKGAIFSVFSIFSGLIIITLGCFAFVLLLLAIQWLLNKLGINF